MVGTVSIDVRPADADRWSDLVSVFGRRGEDPSWCWCQLFLHSDAPKLSTSEPAPDNRAALHEEITLAALPPGLIAYVGDHPVGWTRVGPRSAFPGLRGNRALARILTGDDPGAWWVTCFAVDSRHRRTGIGLSLLQAAVEFAREHGATSVEGHPVDVAALKAARVSGSAIYTGTVAMFAGAGFVEVSRTSPTRPVVRRLV
jgi:GNAT superfamily N-acetyltransferase